MFGEPELQQGMKTYQEPSLITKLNSREKDAQERVEKIKRLKELFEKNPDLKEALQLISEIGM